MSGAVYTFVPWLRRGIGAHVDGASSVTFAIDFGGGRVAQAILPLLGPADVVGFDARVVSRVWPVADTGEVEPNLFPLVEFDQPDLPWRYTPVARAGDRLLPWCALLVLRDDEIASELPAGGSRPLPAVSIANAQLPRLEQAWAWAHVQIAGAGALDADAVAEIVRTRPNQVLSRMLCPRRLSARTRYHAVLVPTFEVSRRAGLGQSIEAVDPATLSWAPGADAVDLPVYHRWSFTTGEGGDFESLAERLKPVPSTGIAAGVPLDASQPGSGLPPAAVDPMLFEGALRPLRPPGAEPPPWPASERDAFVPALAALLDQPADLLAGAEAERAVAPPLYGQYHADQDRVQGGQPPPWFEQLNSDPRLRAAAGLGAEVIRREQSDLVAAAWAQAPGLTEVNDTLRGAQLAREVLTRVHRRHIAGGPAEHIVAVTAPLHARMLASPTTVATRLRESPLAEAAEAGGFRRIARPLGALVRKQGRPAARSTALARLAGGQLAAAPPPRAPAGMVTEAKLDTVTDPQPPRPARIERPPVRGGLRDRLVSSGGFASRPPPGGFEPVEPGEAPRRPAAAAVEAFRRAGTDLLAELEAAVAPAPAPPAPLELTSLGHTVLSALEPERTMNAAFARRLVVAGKAGWRPSDPLEPILLGPEFDRPMAEALARLSPRWLLPGIADLEPNRATLVETNSHFVEAFLVGLNHEMGRELVWREFPTDARKTFFRRFWDTRGAPGGPGPADIEPIHEWAPSSALGTHAPASASTEELVLVLRGEVLHRYPRLIVQATRARWNTSTGARELDAEERAPIFHGALGLDMAFFGFALSYGEAMGTATAAGVGDPGWFFVLAERPGEPRFGLDDESGGPLTSWSELAWTHLAGPGVEVDNLGYIDLDADLPDTRGVSDPGGASWHADAGLGPAGARASDLAYITMQQPFRIAFHAAELLPRRPHA